MPRSRGMTTFGAGLLALTLGAGTLAGTAVYRGGVLRLRVENKGETTRLWIPGVAVPVALRFAPSEPLANASRQAHHLLPALAVLARELPGTPDAVFVEVENSREKVRIEKRGSAVLIDVSSPAETIRAEVPIYVLQSVIERLEDLQVRQ